ncbi:MAG: polyprenyl synthetase family protein [Candidatus Aenigmarchaeota archaeon]|nr:polyprenyl synthetase family protein [Candidatus Aenigmarchaeota archaeon]
MKARRDESIGPYLEKLRPLIDKKIEEWIPRKHDEKSMRFILGRPRYENSPESATKSLSLPIWDFLDRGGKKWRPGLMILVAEALGAKRKDVLDFVAIPEVIHNATLVVDDIEDSSEMRRNKPALHRIYGIDIAINAGNAMYFLPLAVLVKNRRMPAKKAKEIYDVVVQEMINVSFGQALDILWHRGDVPDEMTEKRYLQMCAYKTGALARMAAKLGAIIAGAKDKEVEKVAEFAECIGVAFQIQDDILNVVAGEKWGKEFGEDIKEGKRTLLVIHALQKAGEAERARLVEILNMHTNDKNLLQEAISIIKKHGSIEYAKDYARKIVENSWVKVDRILPGSDAKRKLRLFANFLVEREF